MNEKDRFDWYQIGFYDYIIEVFSQVCSRFTLKLILYQNHMFLEYR